MKKVSVIVPMYNVEKVMSRSVRSLFSQTLTDFEIVFVNDCSTDNTERELKRIISGFDRNDIGVKIITHNHNKGVAAARNTGLDNAAGEYVYYVDSDDYCDNDTLSTMYNEAKTGDYDVVGCEWMLTFKTNARHMVQPDVRTGNEAFKAMCNGVMRWNLWLFMVRRSLYEDNALRFIPGANMGEDLMVMLKLLLSAAKSVTILHCPMYHYIQTNAGAMTKNFLVYRNQVSENISEVERYLERNGLMDDYLGYINQLKLNLKLPLLISDKKSDYELWQTWFSESNIYAGQNTEQPFRTRLIQKAALHKWYIIPWLYYKLVIKFIYGIVYR